MQNTADLMELVAGYQEYAGPDELSADAAAPSWYAPRLPTYVITTFRWAC